MGLALTLYADDNDGFVYYYYMSGTTTPGWPFRLADKIPYSNSAATRSAVWYCPTVRPLDIKYNNMGIYTTYATNRQLGYQKLSRVTKPSEVASSAEANLPTYYTSGAYGGPQVEPYFGAYPFDWASTVSLPHNFQGNIVCVDGHVEAIKPLYYYAPGTAWPLGGTLMTPVPAGPIGAAQRMNP